MRSYLLCFLPSHSGFPVCCTLTALAQLWGPEQLSTSNLRLRCVYFQLPEILGWPKSLFSFFHEIKDTFFIFTNNFIDWDIFSMLAISHVVKRWLYSINVSIWSLSISSVLPHHGTSSSSQKSPAWNFTKHFWCVRSVTTPPPHTAQIFFFFWHFSWRFYLSWNKKNIICWKCHISSSIFNIKMATQKFTNFGVF